MEPLRTRSTDFAPGVGTEEYYGRPSQFLLGDTNLSDGAKLLLAVITLDMAMERTPWGSIASNARLAFLAGKPQGRDTGERWVNRHLAELVGRGYVAVARNRCLAGAPRVVTPTARLRGIRPREADCTPSNLTGKVFGPPYVHPVKFDGSPRQDWPATPSNLTGPILYRESESKREQQQDAETAEDRGVRPVVVLPADAPEKKKPDAPPTRNQALAALERMLVSRFPEAHSGGRARGARKRPGEPTAKSLSEAPRSATHGNQHPTTLIRTSEEVTSPHPKAAWEPDPENPPPTPEELAALRVSLGLTPDKLALAEARTRPRSECARKRLGEPTAKCPPEAPSSTNPGSPKPNTRPGQSATPEG